jgi:hypothetical protein
MKDIVIKMPLEGFPNKFICKENPSVCQKTHVSVGGHDISGSVTGWEATRLFDDHFEITLAIVGRVIFEDTRKDVQNRSRKQSHVEKMISILSE